MRAEVFCTSLHAGGKLALVRGPRFSPRVERIEQIFVAMLACTTPLPISRLYFTARTQSALQPPPYAGSMLRGAFGHALLALAPLAHPGSQACAQHSSCPYCQVFASPALPAHSLQKFSQMPQPFVVEPPLDWSAPLQAGQDFSFSLVLIGKALAHVPSAIEAMERALHTGLGLGAQQTRCSLLAVRAEQASAPLWQAGQPHTPVLARQPLPPASSLGSQAVLHFHTPLRLQYQGKPVRAAQLNARSLLIALARRYQLLLDVHLGAQAPQQDFAALSEHASAIELQPAGMRWFDWGRYSQRQQQEMKLGGLLGSMPLHGNLAPFADLLHLGQWLHVGKNATMGLGGYRLEALQPTVR